MADRPYHHGDLRRALIEAAIELVEEKGLSGLSLREAARRIGVSSGAPYRHFPNKRALVLAVAEELTARQQATIQEVAAELEPSLLNAFRAYAIGGARTVTRQPNLYRLMTSPEVMDLATQEWREEASAQQAQLVALLEQAQAAGELAPGPVEPKLLAGQALSNGLLHMAATGQLELMGIETEGHLEELMMQVTQVLMDGLSPRDQTHGG